jgi:hypothetical protein
MFFGRGIKAVSLFSFGPQQLQNRADKHSPISQLIFIEFKLNGFIELKN